MEQPLENKIAEAFQKRDSRFSYHKKEVLWERLSLLLIRKKGVAAFWRIAAIFFALLLFGGAFAAVTIAERQKNFLLESELKNTQLQSLVDSLKSIEPVKITKVEIVEKEKIVYRDVIKLSENKEESNAGAIVFNEQLVELTKQVQSATAALKITRDSLQLALADLEEIRIRQDQKPQLVRQDFNLKTVQVQDQMRGLKTESSPKMKLQLLKVPDNNIRYNINSSLLKK